MVGLFWSKSQNFQKPFVPSESALKFGHWFGPCFETSLYIVWFQNIYFQLRFIWWFLIFNKARIKVWNSTRKTYIFGKQRPNQWPNSNADSDDTNGFWKFWDFDQNNPTTKFVKFEWIFQCKFTLLDPNSIWWTHFWPLSRWTKQFSKIENFTKSRNKAWVSPLHLGHAVGFVCLRQSIRLHLNYSQVEN